MKQRIPKETWEEFEKVISEREEHHANTITNTTPAPVGSWTEKIVSKVNISDLADELGIDDCPKCHYGIDFDNSRGWFICIKAKYEGSCDFKGNIVEFMRVCG